MNEWRVTFINAAGARCTKIGEGWTPREAIADAAKIAAFDKRGPWSVFEIERIDDDERADFDRNEYDSAMFRVFNDFAG